MRLLQNRTREQNHYGFFSETAFIDICAIDYNATSGCHTFTHCRSSCDRGLNSQGLQICKFGQRQHSNDRFPNPQSKSILKIVEKS